MPPSASRYIAQGATWRHPFANGNPLMSRRWPVSVPQGGRVYDSSLGVTCHW
jgi:hypothetical protein